MIYHIAIIWHDEQAEDIAKKNKSVAKYSGPTLLDS